MAWTENLDAYETKGRPFKSQYSGYCTINPEHEYRKNQKIVRVRLRENTLVTLPGYACPACLRDMPTGRN